MKKRNLERVRISGAEPILGKRSFEHLEKVIQEIYEKNSSLNFILETNGLILGLNKKFCSNLAGYPLAVRISVKGWDNQSFEKISGAKGKFFIFQLKAIKNLQDLGIETWPAIMYEIFGREEIEILKEKLEEMGIENEIEVEYLEKYPFVVENLEKRGITLRS